MITPANAAQIPELARVFREAFRATYPHFPELHTAEEDVAFFRDVIFAKHQVHVAQNGMITGFIAFDRDWVHHLYLLPAAQGYGTGRALLALAQRESTYLQLWTFQENTRARVFYHKHGFREIRETDGAENEEKQPDVLLEWRA